MTTYRASRKNGQAIIARANCYSGKTLHDVYGRFSSAKSRAYDWCMRLYQETDKAEDFHICSHNTYGFSVAWKGELDGEPIVRFETPRNSYIVLINQ